MKRILSILLNTYKLRRDVEKFEIYNRRYLGCKHQLLDFLDEIVKNNCQKANSFVDLFAGTGVVANHFHKKGMKVVLNDLLPSNYEIYKCWFGTQKVNLQKVERILEQLNNIKGKNGYITKTFGGKYFSEYNAKKIDAIREEIINIKGINTREKAVLLTSLVYAADKVANTVGHYDAYMLKSTKDHKIALKLPNIEASGVQAEIYNIDANVLVDEIRGDIVYIDPPYNSRGYENNYHVLDNLVTWEKPKVEGKCNKYIGRKSLSSEYSKKTASEAFSDLIDKLNCKYILVSYNNMEKKGTARSNALISKKQIVNILSRRGKVKIFEKNFKQFTTGKSKLENHKELIYFCEVDSSAIKTPVNYTGSKHTTLPDIMKHFPKDYDRVVDLFGGGGSVSATILDRNPLCKVIYNDINKQLTSLMDFFYINKPADIIERVENVIDKYELSNSSLYGYEHYGARSSSGLSKVNKTPYELLKKKYNDNKSILLLYVLCLFSFNNQIRFNANGMFNVPVGKRDFNKNMKKKLNSFCDSIQTKRFSILSSDYKKVKLKKNDFIYIDPPYLISTATYNEQGMWNEEQEIRLYNYLDELDKKGYKFALSNVFVHKGSNNEILINWSQKYNVHFIKKDYNNSSYKSTSGKTVEVLITNY